MEDAIVPKMGGALLNGDGVVCWVDDELCAILAMERHQVVGTSLGRLFPADGHWPPLRPEAGFLFETPYLRGGGDDWLETVWLRVLGKRLSSQAEQPFTLLVEDVSRDKAKAYALLETQQRYSMIMDASEAPLAFLLPNGTLADCNRAAADLIGVSKAVLVGNPAWVTLWFHGDAKQAERMNAVIGRAREGRAGRIALQTTGSDKSVRDFDYSVKPVLDTGGGLAGLFIEAHDVTEIRRASAEMHAAMVKELSGRLRLLERGVASASDHIVWLDATGNFIDVNESTVEALGYDREQLRSMQMRDVLNDYPEMEYRLLFDGVGRTGQARRELSLRRMDGSFYPVELILTALKTEGVPVMCGIIRDITDRKSAEQRLRILSTAVEQSPLLVVIADDLGRIQYVNQAFCDVTGFTREEVQGTLPNFLNPAVIGANVLEKLQETVLAGGIWRGELHSRKKNGVGYREHAVIFSAPDENGDIAHIVAVEEDISLRDEYVEELRQRDNFDRLTGLANRSQAMDRLQQALQQAARAGTCAVVMVIDIDSLKTINHTLGHAAGDQVISFCGQRIAEIVHDPDLVARVEGGHFLVILSSLSAPEDAQYHAKRVIEACRRPYRLAEQEVFLTARVGLSAFPADGDSPHELIRKAYVAGRRAKQNASDYCYYAAYMDEDSQVRLVMETHLQRAIERDELRVFYQPVVTASSKRIVGAEALLRWNSPELGVVPPCQFIPIAEASGLIVDLSNWVLKTACRDAAAWQQTVWGPFTLAVNFSSRQFDDDQLLNNVMGIAKNAGLPVTSLEVEVTERLLMTDSDRIRSLLFGMKNAGMSLSIDDFGTGYSSLSYLRKFPFSRLKIDQSFVADIAQSYESRCVVTAIVEMAHALGMEVTAEGVETTVHEQILSGLGCELLQGYRFGKPMPAEAFSRLVAKC